MTLELHYNDLKPVQWTINQLLRWSSQYLSQIKDCQTPRLDAEILLAKALNLKRIDLYLHFEKPVNAAERQIFKKFLLRRSESEPVAYIVGEKEFYGLKFFVSPAVLIPRPETEFLVEEVKKYLNGRKIVTTKILEIGTGSGCVTIALAKHFSQIRITAWDISPKALEIAQRNATFHAVQDKIEFVLKDALKEKNWFGQSYDLIVANPPYIAEYEWPHLSLSVSQYEPHEALLAQDNGLIFYKSIAAWSPYCLKPNSPVFLEMNSTQTEQIALEFQKDHWCETAMIKDYNSLNRVLVAKYRGL